MSSERELGRLIHSTEIRHELANVLHCFTYDEYEHTSVKEGFQGVLTTLVENLCADSDKRILQAKLNEISINIIDNKFDDDFAELMAVLAHILQTRPTQAIDSRDVSFFKDSINGALSSLEVDPSYDGAPLNEVFDAHLQYLSTTHRIALEDRQRRSRLMWRRALKSIMHYLELAVPYDHRLFENRP